MFRIATAVAVAALTCAPAMAQTLTAGQYKGVLQYTGLIDPDSICGPEAGLAAGQVTTGVATVAGLGAAWTTSSANQNPTSTLAVSYGTGWINCQYPALPAASAFTASTVGTATQYTASPGAQVTSCVASNGIEYTLSSSNGSFSFGGQNIPQSSSVTILPVNTSTAGTAVTTSLDSGFKITTTNTAVTVGKYTLCLLSTDALYLLSN